MYLYSSEIFEVFCSIIRSVNNNVLITSLGVINKGAFMAVPA